MQQLTKLISAEFSDIVIPGQLRVTSAVEWFWLEKYYPESDAIAISQRYEKELTALVSHRFTIDQAQEAFDLAKSGKCMKVMFTL